MEADERQLGMNLVEIQYNIQLKYCQKFERRKA
jgi:hypothetical protein